MDYPSRLSAMPDYAFPRLRALLDAHKPGGEPILMSLGEPQHAPPAFIADILAANFAEYRRYPPNEGTEGLREAAAEWVTRRYGLPADSVDPDRNVLSLNGSREGLYYSCLALSVERKNDETPAVLTPNPFYPCYSAAALTAGAEPIYVPATPENGFLPEFAALPVEILNRATVAYMCSPSNPQGAVASLDYWKTLLELAERHDFRVFADECYAEIYRGSPPPGVLQAAAEIGANPERVVSFHSLSKRSNLAGLRSGFLIAGAETMVRLKRLRAYAGAPSPIPAQMAAEACWRDEAHVVENRALYAEKYTQADDILADMPGYRPTEAGFFVWLEVGDGEAAALKLWREGGVRALPGGYFSREVPAELGGGNPGKAFLRLALVAPKAEVARGLHIVRDVLREGWNRSSAPA